MTEQAIREIARTLKYRGSCPYCGQTGRIRTRIKSRDRVCQTCGYIGQIQEF